MDEEAPVTPTAAPAPKNALPGLEIAVVVLMSIVAVLTAWSGFEASKWRGAMTISFSQASSLRVKSTSADSEARDARQVDLTIYSVWVEATAQSNEELAGYVADRFTPSFAAAFEAWSADGMVEPSPFARPDYVVAGQEEAVDLATQADAKFQEALNNNRKSDNYSLLTVLFALVLFLAAISQRSGVEWARKGMFGLALVITVVAVVLLATFPIRL